MMNEKLESGQVSTSGNVFTDAPGDGTNNLSEGQMPAVVDVVVIESHDEQRRSIAQMLGSAGLEFVCADELAVGLDLVQQKTPKVVLCEYLIPDDSCAELCATLRQNGTSTPSHIILSNQSTDVDLPIQVIESGADDFLPKPFVRQQLVARVRMGMRMWEMHNRLRKAAITDGLTGLYNHDHFNRVLDVEMGRSRRYGHPLAMMMMDMDYFKAINDTYGHLVGNETLIEVARILQEGVRDIDIVARFGGEEFTVILPQATAQEAWQVADRIRIAFAESLNIESLHNHVVTASFGISDVDDPRVTSSADLVDLADRALYVAKHRGRDQVVTAYELDDGSEVAATVKTDEVEWLRGRVKALSVRAKDVYMQSVGALLQALDEKDPYTARHAMNVAYYAQQLAEHMGCSKATVKSVYNAALLHDIGKVGVPDRILMKRTPLSQLERMVLEQVPLIGTRIVDHLRILESEMHVIRHQREHFDGSGFPSGLVGSQIPIGSRILLVADAFDAMTTDRVYRRRRPLADAVSELQNCSERQFDPRTVTALRQILQKNKGAWQQRIDETIRVMKLPNEARLTTVKDQPWADSIQPS